MSTDLGLDPSDPLNLLLHNSSQAQSADSSMTSSDSSSQQQSQNELEDLNAQDWSKFSALWADPPSSSASTTTTESLKPYPDMDMMPMDFADLSSSMGMDMDFNPSMAIEPMALHYDPTKFISPGGMGFAYDDQYGMSLSSELLASQFPFTFQFGGENGSASDVTSSSSSASAQASPQSFRKERRLSVTSSSSSSGASLSPVPESVPSPAAGYASDSIQPKEEPVQSQSIPSNPYANDPAAELAERVRQSAGVMLALPMHAQLQSLGHLPMSNSFQAKLPIPRLPRHNSISGPISSASTSSSAASTPPPSTPPPSSIPTSSANNNPHFKLAVNTSALPAASADVSSTPMAGTPASALPRPKTSHTTIERRYRTNLNARIQSLRMAVPALRVLEDREGGNGKKIKKNLKGNVVIKGANNPTAGVGMDGEEVDVIDERGFVDGVKVARKCSKANVLGKAVEYIRVLKKRETRLKAEQAGLKTLVAGLVGGPALVKEWEKEWRARFGGEERDEVEGDEEGEEGDESSEDDDGDDDDEGGRKRKRAKAAPTAKKAADKEKKKTVTGGVAPLVMLTSEQLGANPAPEKRKRGRPRKVLPPPVSLASAQAGAAADQTPAAEPAVQEDELMYPPTTQQPLQPQWAQQQQPQQPQPQQYLLAVFALFSFFNSPLTSSSSTHVHAHTGTVLTAAQPPLAYAPDIIAQFVAPAGPSVSAGWAGQAQAQWQWQEWIQLFHLAVSVLVLASFVASWLGVGFDVGKLSFEATATKATPATTRKRLTGPGGWARFGEESVLEGRALSLSFYERIQIYRTISTKRNASVGDLTTLALVVRSATGGLGGLARVKAGWVWDGARQLAQRQSQSGKKVAEALVFEELEGLEEAAALLAGASANGASSEESIDKVTPLEAVAGMVVKERVKRHLGRLFVRAVAGSEQEEWEESNDGEEKEEEGWRKTVDAARELGGSVEVLGRLFERAWKASADALDDADLSLNDEDTNANTLDGQIRVLLAALVLYRRLFSFLQSGDTPGEGSSEDTDGCETPLATSTLLSPPPSPRSTSTVKANERTAMAMAEDLESVWRKKERGRMMFVLRRVLGSRVFEDGEVMKIGNKRNEEQEEQEEEAGEGRMGLEDAKDRVVDMIVEVERRERRSV